MTRPSRVNGHQLWNSGLVNLLKSCITNGDTNYAKKIFEAENLDASTWNSLIKGFSQDGSFKEACFLYTQMNKSGVRPVPFTFAAVLRACARLFEKKIGCAVHSQICKTGFSSDVYALTGLVDMYSKFSDMESARKVFDGMCERSVVSWNSVIAGYVKCEELTIARKLFDEMPDKDIVSWNSMLAGYVKGGQMGSAMELFNEMHETNAVSWNTIIGGYIGMGKMDVARQFFDRMPEKSNVSFVTMISGYAQHGAADLAHELFDRVNEKDRSVWNAMIACYAQNGRAREAIELFNQMLQCNMQVRPDKKTMVSVVSACSQLGDVSFGQWVLEYSCKIGIEMDDHLITAFVDLYGKCGDIDRARSMFLSLQNRDVVAYTAMILGYAMHGDAMDSIRLFSEMVADNVKPNAITFIGLLTACIHSGLVDEGRRYFYTMSTLHAINPSREHYACMVDLLGRAGQLEEAYELIRSMPMAPHAAIWGALLLACKIHCNVELGEIAAHHCFKLEPDASGYHILLSNIYASAGRWDDSKRLRKVAEEQSLTRTPGYSWIEVEGRHVLAFPPSGAQVNDHAKRLAS